MTGAASPTVTVAVPVLNEARSIEGCLASIGAQTYPAIVEVLVVDGGSDDGTPGIAAAFPGVRVLDNPGRIQATALNVALGEARGEVVVRVDGHARLAPDYVEGCVAALETTGAAMVGGAMRPVGEGWRGRGIAAAMASRIGAGPAPFHSGGTSGFVDTVYLGAFRRDLALEVGGYDPGMVVNEDAELAIRMRPHGGIWLDERIRSAYTPRRGFVALARQFYRYGKGRARTVRRHPRALAPRQLAAPTLVLGLLSPWRRWVLSAYATLVVARSLLGLGRRTAQVPGLLIALPTMHLSWGIGFLRGLLAPSPSPR